MRLNRILASLLALLMVFSLLPAFGLSAAAEDEGTISLVEQEEPAEEPAVEPAESEPMADDEPGEGEEYPEGLWVCGVEVTEENASDILGNGNVRFDSDTNTLTFTEKRLTPSGLYYDSVVYANIGNLTIEAPKGLSFTAMTAKYGVMVVGGALTINGNLNFTLEAAAEACVYADQGLTMTGNAELDAAGDNSSYYGVGIAAPNGPVTVEGYVFTATETGIFCGSGNVTVRNYFAIMTDTWADDTAGIRAVNGSVDVGALECIGNVNYAVYADGDIHVRETVYIDNGFPIGGEGIRSVNGKVVCDGTVTMGTSDSDSTSAVDVYIYAGGEEGIQVAGEAFFKSRRAVETKYALAAPNGPITFGGDLNITGGGLDLILAKDDITIAGNAVLRNDLSQTTVKPYDGRAMTSTDGSICVTGNLQASSSNSGVFASKDISVGGSVTLNGSIRKLFEYGLKAETGALTVGGDLTCTRLAECVVYGHTGIQVDGAVTLSEAFIDDLDPTGCYAMNAPEGSIDVGGTVTIVPKPQYGYSGSFSGPEFGVNAGGQINIADKWEVTAVTAALRAADGLVMPEGYGIVTPRNGMLLLLDGFYSVTKFDGTEAPHAVITVAEAEAPVTVLGKSLSLKGKIEMNFYLDLPDYVLADPGAYVSINGEKFPVSEAEASEVRGETGYCFTAKVKFAQLTEDRILRVLDSNGDPYTLMDQDIDLTATGLIYQAQDYIEYVRETSEDKALVAVVEALSDVGSLAQAQFEYNLDSRVEVVNDLSAVTVETVKDYKPVLDAREDSPLRYYGSSLLLKDITTLRHYFKLPADSSNNYTFTVDGEEVVPVLRGGYYTIDIQGIVARDLDRSFHVEVTDEDGVVISLDYSAMSYAWTQLNAGNEGVLTDLAKAVVLYCFAANEFFTD